MSSTTPTTIMLGDSYIESVLLNISPQPRPRSTYDAQNMTCVPNTAALLFMFLSPAMQYYMVKYVVFTWLMYQILPHSFYVPFPRQHNIIRSNKHYVYIGTETIMPYSSATWVLFSVAHFLCLFPSNAILYGQICAIYMTYVPNTAALFSCSFPQQRNIIWANMHNLHVDISTAETISYHILLCFLPPQHDIIRSNMYFLILPISMPETCSLLQQHDIIWSNMYNLS